MLGATLVTIQTGPAGKQVNRLYIEDGSDIAKEFYLSMLVDRSTSRIAFVVSTEGGMDIEEVAHKTPEKIVTFSVDPATGIQAITAAASPRRSTCRRPRKQAGSVIVSSTPRSSRRTWRCSRSIR